MEELSSAQEIMTVQIKPYLIRTKKIIEKYLNAGEMELVFWSHPAQKRRTIIKFMNYYRYNINNEKKL